MQNRFTLKDFVLLVVVLAVGVSQWLSMVQRDRDRTQMAKVEEQLGTVAQQLGRMQQSLDQNAREMQKIGSALAEGVVARPATDGGSASAGPRGGRDESWARPGVAVEWAAPSGFTNDPTKAEGFVEGGEFVQIFEGQPAVVTSFRYGDTYGRYVNDEVVESLGRYNVQTLKLEHLLAAAWQMDPEGMWLRVRIRDEARFSDGKPVTAEDVRWTHDDFLYNPEVQADRFRSVTNGIAKIEVLGEKVVEIQFKERRFDNKQQAALMPVLPKHFFSRFTPAQINTSTGLLMGSGPYRFPSVDPDNQWAPPQDIVLVRNESYWGPRPAVERIRFKVVQDSLARLTTFTNQQADFARPTAAQFDKLKDDPSFNNYARAKMWYNVQGGWSFICWQTGPRAGGKLTPFSDRRVRLAMTHLIDREKIKRDISKDLVRLATGPFNSETPQANPRIQPWPYDVEKAKALLDEAGWKIRDASGFRTNEKGERFTFQLTFGQGNDSTLQMVTYVKDQCAMVGIDCQLAPIDWSVLQSILDRRDFDAITFAWSSSAPETDPTQLWAISSIEGTGDNFGQWRNEEADALIKKGRQTIDDDERMKVWHELHRVIHEDQPYTPLHEQPWLRLVNNRVGNFNMYRMGMDVSEFFMRGGAGSSKQP